MTEVTPGGPTYRWAKHWRSDDLKACWVPRAYNPNLGGEPFPGNDTTDPGAGSLRTMLEDQSVQFETRARERPAMCVDWPTFVVTWARAYNAAFESGPARGVGDLNERREYARVSACRYWRMHLRPDHPCYWPSSLPSSMVYYRVMSPLEAPNVFPKNMPPPPKAQKRPMTDEEKFQYQLKKKFEQERKKLEESR